jgi:hypothetical protein
MTNIDHCAERCKLDYADLDSFVAARPSWKYRYPVRSDGHLLGEITHHVGARAFEALDISGRSLGVFATRVAAALELGRVRA